MKMEKSEDDVNSKKVDKVRRKIKHQRMQKAKKIERMEKIRQTRNSEKTLDPVERPENFATMEYWESAILEMEIGIVKNCARNHLKVMDYSVILPPKLRNRVKTLIPYGFDDYDRNVFMEEFIDIPNISEDSDDEDADEAVAKKKKLLKDEMFNESTCSEIERMENEFPKCDVKFAVSTKHRQRKKDRKNWFSKYICQTRKERVHWDSKVYNLETSLWEKSLDEQAEILMDASAERFTEWLNNVGNKNECQMSKAQLKALFAIESDRNLLAAIHTEPKEVKAIAKTVADKWNIPDMAIELKYEKYITERLKHVPKTVITVAFGRTIPQNELPWLPGFFSSDKPITTVFPTEILSGEKLFKGIRHLRTVKGLVEFSENHPDVERPDYLVRTGMFNKRETTTATQEVPLYERLKLKY